MNNKKDIKSMIKTNLFLYLPILICFEALLIPAVQNVIQDAGILFLFLLVLAVMFNTGFLIKHTFIYMLLKARRKHRRYTNSINY